MNKTLKYYIAFFVLVSIGIIAIDASRPKPIDWTPSFSTKDKIPLGLFVLNKEINGLFPNQKIERFSNSIYEFLNPKYNLVDSTYKIKGTLLMISDNDEIDQSSLRELCKFVSRGNTAFLSMQYFPRNLMDTLKTNAEDQFMQNDSTCFSLCNGNFDQKTFTFKKGTTPTYFTKIDTLTTTVLGYQKNDSIENINFIKVPFKKGMFYLHVQPAVFTNYYLLDQKNAQYSANLLSYIPEGNIYWHAKISSDKELNSPMRYILRQPALKWAWYIFLAGILIFMIFKAKRKQRIIPIKEPLQNTTVDFTKTIGNLYHQEGDHHNIIDKKIIYFLEKVRNDYRLDTSDLDDNFVNRLQQKTGKEKPDIEKVVKLIKRHMRNSGSSEKDVIEISKAIEKLQDKH